MILQGNDIILVCKELRDFEPDKKLNRALIAFHNSIVTYMYDMSNTLLKAEKNKDDIHLPGLALVHIHTILVERRRDLHQSLMKLVVPREINILSDEIINLSNTIRTIETIGKGVSLEYKDFQTYSKNIILVK